MKAVLLKQGRLRFGELSVPAAGAGEALVKVKMAGICNTDLELVKGYMGFEGVLGHEFVGVVAETEDRAWTGKRVCGEINFGCGDCDWCRRGLNRHCPSRTVLGILNQNGAFAEYVIIPVQNLRAVPDSVSDVSAVFVEPLAAAFEILEQVKIEPIHKVAVVGDGKLGLLVSQVLKLTGCDLTLIGKHDRKLALARSWGLKTARPEEANGREFDIAVEASGAPAGFETAMRALKPRGKIVLKSTYAGKLELDAAAIVIDEITVVGSRCGLFDPAIRALANNLVQVEEVVDEVFPFSNALLAFERANQSGTLKVLLDLEC